MLRKAFMKAASVLFAAAIIFGITGVSAYAGGACPDGDHSYKGYYCIVCGAVNPAYSVDSAGVSYYTSKSDAAAGLQKSLSKEEKSIDVYYLCTSSSDFSSAAAAIYSAATDGKDYYIASHSFSSSSAPYAEGTLLKITYSITYQPSVSDAGVSYYKSESKAVSYLKSKMKSRSSSVTLYILCSSSSYPSAPDLLDDAYEYTGTSTEGDYLHRNLSSSSCKSSVKGSYREGYLVKYTYSFVWRDTSSQEEAVSSKASEILSSLGTSGKSDYKKAKLIYDYLCNNVSYDSASKGSSTETLRFTAYAALVKKKATCLGFANAFYYLANKAGLECRIVLSSGGEHAWNIVKIGSRWYNVDASWDAGKSSYKYFLKSNATYESIHSGYIPANTYGNAVSSSDYSPISKASLSYTSVTYSGKAKKPSVVVKDSNGNTLTKGTDYTVTYSNNTAIGKATVKIKGKGKYSGSSITKTFKIKPKKVSLSSAKSSSKKSLTVSWEKSSGSVKYQIAYRKKGSSKWKYKTVSASTYKKKITGLSSGKYYYVKVRAYKKVGGKTYYGKWSSVKKVKIK